MDPSLFPAQGVLDAATVVGARMYGLESGRIAVGALADCMLVDLNRPCMTPHHHLVSNLVYSANGGCVDTVICDGRILLRKGVVAGEEEILAHARETAVRLAGAARSGERVLLIYTGSGKGKTSACVGQAVRVRAGPAWLSTFMKRAGQAGEQTMLARRSAKIFSFRGWILSGPGDYARHRQKALELLLGRRADGRGADMLILDEILYALGHGR